MQGDDRGLGLMTRNSDCWSEMKLAVHTAMAHTEKLASCLFAVFQAVFYY